MLINPANVMYLLILAFKNDTFPNTTINVAEREFSSELEVLIRRTTSSSYGIESFETLDIDENQMFDSSLVPDEIEHENYDDESIQLFLI